VSQNFKDSILGRSLKFVSRKFKQLIFIVVALILVQTAISVYHEAPLPGAIFPVSSKVDPSDNRGQPMGGLSTRQLAAFREGEAIFKKKFTIKEGLGPLFNGESCFECHGQPSHAIGGEGRDNSSTSIINFCRRIPSGPKAKGPLGGVIENLGKRDVDFFLEKGGPSLQRRSITTENPDLLPFAVQIDSDMIPAQSEIISARHSPPVFGDGLIDNIADSDILANALKQAAEDPEMAGRPISAVDRYTELPRVGRLGWKNQNVNVLNFTTGAMNIELGLTTWLNQTENSSKSFGIFPMEVQKILPPGPNDKGEILVKLTYFQSLLAPPKRGEITPEVSRGEKLFEQAKCSVCHIPEMKTAPQGYVVDPDSPLPKLNYLELDCLSDKPVKAYSDFLVHQMGRELADGFPQEGAKGGEWRTTPLWGLRFKKFYLHDGRTEVLHDAIMAHGGQASKSRERYVKMSEEERTAILAFLKSL
jgi:CxxC motif-containing protein (DUF1111 family)